MKSKEFWKLVFNPFTRIAGWQAFGVGMLFIIAMGALGAKSNIIFDGIIDMHMTNNVTLSNSFAALGIDLVCSIAIMWITGLIISKGFRFVDILGTMTLAKAPFLILAIIGLFVQAPDMSEIMKSPYAIFDSMSFIALLILSIPIIIWSIALMVNALKVSCDIRGSKLTASFIIALLVAETSSKVLIYLMLKI